MQGAITYRVLGPLEVLRDGEVLPIPSPRQRTILGSLLLRSGRAVSAEKLIDRLWDEEPPPTARAATHVYVGRVRRLFGDAVRIETRPDGYVLDPPPGALDLREFDDLVARAGAMSQSAPEESLTLFRAALGLWRGPILSDVRSATLHREEVAPLTERCVEAMSQRFDLELRLGRHETVIPELTELAALYPLRERLRAQLMLALYRCGRRADALEVYRATFTLLREDLGLDPAEELKELHAAILTDSVPPVRSPAVPVTSTAAGRSPDPLAGEVTSPVSGPVPAQLLSDISAFTGRRAELARLRALTAAHGEARIVAFAGMAGVGKSALAIHLAHQLKHGFPDGQLFINLRGFDDGEPLHPSEALQRFLRALGMPGELIPTDVDEQAAVFRSRVAGRKLLVVLDNARSSEQVRPLLPGVESCLVLVTSRRRLDGLVAREGARQILLDVLSAREATDLLQGLVGADRIAADPRSSRSLIELCDRLPLVLRIAAARLQQHPGRPVSDLVDELSDENERLSALAVEGDDTAVRATFNLSYRLLPDATARLFRLLSLHPGTDWTVAAAAAIVGTSPAATRLGLRRLTDAHLLQEVRFGRYAMHDLLRLYARLLTEATDSEEDRATAADRLIDYYLTSADAASRPLEADSPPPVRRIEHRPAQVLRFSGHEGLTWLDTERANCRAVTELASRLGRDERTWQLADALWVHQLMRMNRQDWLELHTLGLTAARRLGDLHAEQRMLRRLARGHARCQQFDQAVLLCEKAIALARRLTDPRSEACALINLASTYDEMGEYDAAIGVSGTARSLAHAHGLTTEEALTLANMAGVLLKLNRPDEAIAACEESIELFREVPATHHRVTALIWAAEAHHQLGETSVALERFQEALAESMKTGDRETEAESRYGIGKALLEESGPAEALPYLEEARSIFAKLGFPQAQQVSDVIHRIESTS